MTSCLFVFSQCKGTTFFATPQYFLAEKCKIVCANVCAHTISKLLINSHLAVAHDIHSLGQSLDGIRGLGACGKSTEL